MTDPRKLSDDEVTTLAGKVAVVLTSSDRTIDLTNLTLEDFKALAAQAMGRVDAGLGELTDSSKRKATPNHPSLCTTIVRDPPHTKCDSDTVND